MEPDVKDFIDKIQKDPVSYAQALGGTEPITIKGDVIIPNDTGGVTHRIGIEDRFGLACVESEVSTTHERPKMILNPDPFRVQDIIHAIQHNDGYCPELDAYKTEGIKCPCDDFIMRGDCPFGLFVNEKEE